MSHTVLLVDDDANILQAYRRALHKWLDIETALGGVAEMIAYHSGLKFPRSAEVL